MKKQYRLPLKISEAFHKAYQNPTPLMMVKEISKILDEDFVDLADNKHVQWLRYTLKNIQRSASARHTDYEVPGMLCGMLYDAFMWALSDYSNYLKQAEIELYLPQEHAAAASYLVFVCDQVFVKPTDHVQIVTVADYMNLVADVIIDEHIKLPIASIDRDFIQKLLGLTNNPEITVNLEPYATALRAYVKKTLEEYVVSEG